MTRNYLLACKYRALYGECPLRSIKRYSLYRSVNNKYRTDLCPARLSDW